MSDFKILLICIILSIFIVFLYDKLDDWYRCRRFRKLRNNIASNELKGGTFNRSGVNGPPTVPKPVFKPKPQKKG